ncbi:MAG: hypothetical protein M1836_007294 [Candelina mexicana]|nr:MAG: hypothetical protein M1836_007294 [Candelina mexicana]
MESGPVADRLLDEAENAQDVAAGLNRFLDAIPECSTEITAVISELFAISSALRELHTALASRRYGRRGPLIEDDMELALPSLNITLEDIVEMFGRLGRSPLATAYRRVWKVICLNFRDEGGISLCSRLEIYRTFFIELALVLTGAPTGPRDMETLRARIEDLLELQNQPGIDVAFDGLTLGRRAPLSPPMSSSRPQRRIPYETFLPTSPLSSDYSDREYPFPPPAPDVPQSPSSTTFSSLSSGSSGSGTHWASRIFDGRHSITAFNMSGQPSKCLGPELNSSESILSRDSEKLIELSFENSALIVRLYYRPADQRARILCLSAPDRPGRVRKQCCLPLTSLQIFRAESCLQLCRSSRSRRTPQLWANLKFSIYERMVLFFCTFLALKAHDTCVPRPAIDDYILDGETEKYGGMIEDDNFLHALRIFKDRDSGGVRLEASVLRGELQRTPVWTAFVTQYLGSTNWMRRIEPKVIQLRDLHPYVFSPDYTPQRGPRGEHELRFTTAQGKMPWSMVARL